MKVLAIRHWDSLTVTGNLRQVWDHRLKPGVARDRRGQESIAAERDRAVLTSAWFILLDVAEQSPLPGVLVRAGGVAHDEWSLACDTHSPRTWFERAIPFFLSIDWLTLVETELGLDGAMRRVGSGPLPPEEAPRLEHQEPSTIPTAPGLRDVLDFATANFIEDAAAIAFFDHFSARQWVDSNGRSIRSWRGRLRRWWTDWILRTGPRITTPTPLPMKPETKALPAPTARKTPEEARAILAAQIQAMRVTVANATPPPPSPRKRSCSTS